MTKKVVIAGSRHFNDYDFFSQKVKHCLSQIGKEYEVIILSGHCSGVDLMAEQYANDHHLNLELFPAEWKKYGRSAGPIRNRQMIEAADFVIAFPSGGKGTKSLISFAQKKNLPIEIIQI